jgi:hypothetical protein
MAEDPDQVPSYKNFVKKNKNKKKKRNKIENNTITKIMNETPYVNN